MKENIELITAFLTFAGTLSAIILKPANKKSSKKLERELSGLKA